MSKNVKDASGNIFPLATVALPDGSTAQSVVTVNPSTGNPSAQTATETSLQSVLTALGLLAKASDTQPVSATELPLPSGAATQTTLASVLAAVQSLASALPLPTGAATQTTLASVLEKLPSDPATQTTLDAILAKLTVASSESLTLYKASDGTAAVDMSVGLVSSALPTVVGRYASFQIVTPTGVAGTWSVEDTNTAMPGPLSAGWDPFPAGNYSSSASQPTGSGATTTLCTFATCTSKRLRWTPTSGGTGIMPTSILGARGGAL